MSLADAVAAVRSRAESLWPGIESAVPLAFPNENFQRPLDSAGAPLPFVMIELRWNGGDVITIGAPGDNVSRRDGQIWAHAFIPQGTGESRAHQLASEAAGMFENQDFAGLICAGMQPGGPADSEDGSYFGQSAAIPFTFDETA